MNYTNMIIFKDKAVADQAQKNLKEIEPKLDIKQRTVVIDKIKTAFQSSIRNSYAGEIWVSFIPNLIVAYHDGDEIKYSSVIEKWFDKNVNLFDLYDEKDKEKKKTIVYSFLYSYYFTIGNYKKVIEIIRLVHKEKTNFKYFELHNSLFMGYTMVDIYRDDDRRHNDELVYKRNLLMLYAMSGSKEFKKEKYYQNSYISDLSALARNNRINDFLSDQTILTMHQKVMHDYFEGKKSNISHRDNYSLLDNFETKPDTLTDFLNLFQSSSDDSYFYHVHSRGDWQISQYLDELDSNKERLVEIFNSYLYSQYALGQKTFKLEDRILRMCSVLSVLGYDEYNVMDIVEGLPEKIQRAALTGFVGD